MLYKSGNLFGPLFRLMGLLPLIMLSVVIILPHAYAQKVLGSENPFYNYLAVRFQEKAYSGDISKKIWNYLSNPLKGYKNAGLSAEEYASLVRDYARSAYSKKILEYLLEVLKIDTRENLPEEKKSENTLKYINHIERLAQDFGLSVMNIDNRFLVVYSEGDQPPLGIVGKIKTSANFLKYDEPVIKDNYIVASHALSSKAATELALFSAGIINTINLRQRNRVVFYIDLSMSSVANMDVLFNSYELAPINLVVDSVFPLACAEYGYAMVKIVQNIGDKLKNSPVRKIVADGGEYQTPSAARICFEPGKIDKDTIKDSVAKFLRKYNKVEIKFPDDEEYCMRFSVSPPPKGTPPNALDYLVLLLTENRELLPENLKLFEYLRRYITLKPSGKILGIKRSHNLLRNTEVILKRIIINGGSCTAELYIRFPYGIESSVLVEKIKGSVDLFNSRESSDIETYISAYNPVVVDPNSEIALRIRKAYRDAGGGKDKCFIADGVYTKLFPNAIGFGPDMHNLSGMSQISETDILKVLNIYLTALIYLMEKYFYEDGYNNDRQNQIQTNPV